MGLTAPTETEIQRGILILLDRLGIMAWRNNSRVVREGTRLIRFSVRGAPDILGVLPRTGRALGIEVKRPGQQLTPWQRAFLERMRLEGGLAFVASSANEVQERLYLEGVAEQLAGRRGL